jgi:hypothetical protein
MRCGAMVRSTKRRGHVDITPASYSGCPRLKPLSGELLVILIFL